MPAAFPDYLDPTEAKIINRLISKLLDAKFYVAVHDGEEMAIRPTRDRKAIQREVAATDLTYLIAYTFNPETNNYKRIGSVFLVHGNGADVISDHTDRPEIAAVVDPVSAFAETL